MSEGMLFDQGSIWKLAWPVLQQLLLTILVNLKKSQVKIERRFSLVIKYNENFEKILYN